MSTQVELISKAENEENEEVLAKVWNFWKRIKSDKKQKTLMIRKKLVKFLRQKKKFIQFISAQKEKEVKIKSFYMLKSLKTPKILNKKIFLKKFFIAWKKHKNSVKKFQRVSFIIQEKNCLLLEKKLFFMWKERFRTLTLLSKFLKNREKNCKKKIYFFLGRNLIIQKNKRKVIKKMILKKIKKIFRYFFFKWVRYSSSSKIYFMSSQISSLKTSNFLQQCEIKDLKSQIADLNTALLFHQDNAHESDLKLLLKRHAEDLYKSICS
jgi:hypothetical protein